MGKLYRESLVFLHIQDCEPQIAPWIGALQDSRRRTLDVLQGFDEQYISWVSANGLNSIGALLYHIAAIEMDWLYDDVLGGQDFPAEIDALMAYPVRDGLGHLASVSGESLAEHLHRLKVTRRYLLAVFCSMTLVDFHRQRNMSSYDVSPAYVLHHLLQHEAEHRSQIREMIAVAAAGRSL